MQLYSTNNKNNKVFLKEAVMQSLAVDKGLYMPEVIPALSPDFIKNIDKYSFQEIAFEVSRCLIGDYVPSEELKKIVDNAIKSECVPIICISQFYKACLVIGSFVIHPKENLTHVSFHLTNGIGLFFFC